MSETKLVRINLAAFTRVEYSEIIEVPADMTDAELNDLVAKRYDDVDGGEYSDDSQYWEQATCNHESASTEDGDAPEFKLSRVDGCFEIEPVEA